jgi:hypothetical protein
MKHTILEEQALVDKVLDLDACGFPATYARLRDMANLLLTTRGSTEVGANWPATFVKRRPELKTRFSRRYDRRRALCEDYTTIAAWFQLVQNVKAKYGILNKDTWNFDETGFIMGVISSSLKVITGSEKRHKPKQIQQGNREWVSLIVGVSGAGQAVPLFIIFQGKTYQSLWYKEPKLPRQWVIAVLENGWTNNQLGIAWIKHFDAYTKEGIVGAYRLLILNGYESHSSAEFEQYCADNKIITLCMLLHSSHILQPLDVGCFSLIKKAYSRQLEHLVCAHINHITKTEFLPAYIDAYNASIQQSSI